MSQGVLTIPHHQLDIQLSGTADSLTGLVHTYHPADGESHVTSTLNGDIHSVVQQLLDYLLGTEDAPAEEVPAEQTSA